MKDPAHNLLPNLPQRERRTQKRKGKGGVRKKRSHDSCLKDTSVYLQRDRARLPLKRKDAQYCFMQHITHTLSAMKRRNNIPPDKRPLMAIAIKIEYISKHILIYEQALYMFLFH